MSKIIDLRRIKKEREVSDIDGLREEVTVEEIEVLEVEREETKKLEIEKLETKKLRDEVFDVDKGLEGKQRAESEKTDERGKGGVAGFFIELVKVVVISLAIVLPVRYFLIQPFYVKGASMDPTFYDHEYLIINELVYRIGEPERGDIVVFKYPRQPSQYFIKRIVGLPGERVMIKDNKVIIFNEKYREGKELDESSYLPVSEKTEREVDITLKDDEYFVLGDNRAHSLDSRSFGPVPRENIVGKTWLRGWPIDRLKKFGRPEYNL